MLRIDPKDPDGAGGKTYRIPGNNPYVGKPGRDEIWAHGLRSPWRYSFDRANGNLWLGDVGQNKREEVNKSRSNRKGRQAARKDNFGWDDCEGPLEFELDEGDKNLGCSTHKLPIHAYKRNPEIGRCSVTGGYVYRGPVKKNWRGLYGAGDFCGGLFVLDQKGKRRWYENSGVSIASFGEDVAGRIYAVGIFEGTVYRVRMKGTPLAEGKLLGLTTHRQRSVQCVPTREDDCPASSVAWASPRSEKEPRGDPAQSASSKAPSISCGSRAHDPSPGGGCQSSLARERPGQG